jgi:hypothetical protein
MQRARRAVRRTPFFMEAELKQRTVITTVLLGGVIVLLIVMLLREAASGPTFRAADYPTYAECIAAIPFRPGSLEQSGSEAACRYEHERRLREQQ